MGFYGQCFFFFFFTLQSSYGLIVKINFKRFMVIYWPFVLQFQALLSILFHPFCLGAFVVGVDFGDLEANLFLAVLFV